MAVYCTKCGSEIPGGNQFCAKCGAPIPAPMAAPPPQPVGYPPQTMAPPARSNNTLKVVLIIVAIFVGLGIVGLGAVGFIGWRVSRSVHVNSSTGEVTLRTPEGTLSANTKEKFTAEDLGIDLYPGSTPTEGGMRMTVPTGSMVTGVFVTPDSQDQVVQFYKGKVDSEASVMESAEGAVITAKHGEKESLVITVSPNSTKAQGKTQITIVRTIATKSA